MANKKITGLTAAGALSGTEPIEIVQGGVNKQTTTQDIADLAAAGSNNYRGDFVGTTAFPSTGGTYTAGAPAKGNRWRVITNPIEVGGNVYPPGTIVEAAVDGAGATTLTDWNKYAVQL